MSWAPEVQTGNDHNWYGNSLRFATKEESDISAKDLMDRWLLVVAYRSVESDDPVNYQIKNGVMSAVKPAAIADLDDKGGEFGGCAA